MPAKTCLPLTLLLAVQAASALAAQPVDFEREIAPVLIGTCVGCHNGSDPAGGLNLTTAATSLAGGESESPAIVAGKGPESPLVARIRAGEMPPEGKGPRPSEAEIARLEAWIAQGAAWPEGRVLSAAEFTSDTRAGRDWWSLAPVRRPELPTVRHADRLRTPIDALVFARLEAEGLAPAVETDRATFIRRATLDLHGLPPTPEAITAFVADGAPDAYEKLIDSLLASPRYGERWARHWLDVARFGESNGYETNTARSDAWHYRDWVIQAFNNDLPLADFAFQQLAGDQVGVDAATGFLVGGAHDIVASPDIELTLTQRMNDLDDILSTTAGAFLGLTVGCARCHDHKFDPISQRDYYALQAVFAGVQHGQRELRGGDNEQKIRERSRLRVELASVESQAHALWTRHQPLAHVGSAPSGQPRPAPIARLNVDRFVPVSARLVRFTVLATSQTEPCIDELEIFTADGTPRNVAAAAAGAKATASSVFAGGRSDLHKLEHINDGRYGNAHSWISAESGAGWVQVELAEPTTIDRIVWARDRDGGFRDRVPTRYKIEVSDTGEQWQTVATSDDRLAYDPGQEPKSPASDGLPPEITEQVARHKTQIETLRAQLDALAPQKAYVGTFAQPEATHLLYRGEPMQKREAVAPSALASVGPPLALAADAPEAERRAALARWIGSPRNPLPARVMVNRIWHYHFGQGLVKTPSDFGWGGGRPSHGELLDWLAAEFLEQGGRPKAIHRMIMLSHVYRQSSATNAQAVAVDAQNRLLWRFAPRRLEAEAIRDSVLSASGVLDLRMGGPGYDAFEPNTNYVKVYTPRQSFGPSEWRRMVYQHKPRMRQDGTFGEFDCPDSSQTMARRNVSTTALQALNLLNGSFMVQQAEVFAGRLSREMGENVDSQVQRAFWLALGRAADDGELHYARELVAGEGLVVFCRALLNANEFLYIN